MMNGSDGTRTSAAVEGHHGRWVWLDTSRRWLMRVHGTRMASSDDGLRGRRAPAIARSKRRKRRRRGEGSERFIPR
jgi:hypothetical protein